MEVCLQPLVSINSNINISIAKAWNGVDCLSIVWKYDVFDKIKRKFFQTVDALHGHLQKKLDGNNTRTL